MTTDDAALLAVAQKANALFVILGGIERILKPVSTVSARLSSPYREIADAFGTNIRSVIFTAGLPYMFALVSSHLLAARIAEELGASGVSAFATSHVVFFLAREDAHLSAIERAKAAVEIAWRAQIDVWPEVGQRSNPPMEPTARI